jgi:trk system potassium uptake protein
LLLILPMSLRPGVSLNVIDALFTSVSAIAVTGLTTVPISGTFSLFGQSVILVLIQLGGIGIVAVSIGLVSLTGSKLSISQSLMGRLMYDLPQLGGVRVFIRNVVTVVFAAELIGCFWIYFSLPADTPYRMFQSVFHAVSAFCNAGFSTFPDSLNVAGLGFLKIGIALLIIVGGMGFPVIFEVLPRLSVYRSVYRPLSANTVLTLSAACILLLVGAAGIFLSESFMSLSPLAWGVRLEQSLFYSVSSRTAGFNMLAPAELTFGTQFFILCLMFIGGASVSTAGGIKTSTATVVALSTLSLLRGHQWIQLRKREISMLVLQKAVAIIVLYLLIMVSAILVLLAIERENPWTITFEVVSALSTVGLSLGVTPQLSLPGKLVIIALMFTGRLGIITMVYVGIGQIRQQRFRYAKEDLYVG